MNSDRSRITLHMVASLDGFIAKKDNSVGWFETSSPYEKGVDWQGPGDFMKSVDCYVMGATTYEHAVALSEEYYWAYGDTPTIVVTHRDLPKVKPHIEFFAGDLKVLVHEVLRPRFKNVWVAGGAVLANEFLRQGLADDLRLAILPIMLGEGLPFFDGAGKENALRLLDTAAYKNGLVELHYEFVKP